MEASKFNGHPERKLIFIQQLTRLKMQKPQSRDTTFKKLYCELQVLMKYRNWTYFQVSKEFG